MDNKQMEEKRFINAIDFLIFSYWGFSIGEKTKDETDTVIKKIVSKAYNDAAGQRAFNALIGREEGELRKKADKAKKAAIDSVSNGLKKINIENIDLKSKYKDWHKDLCNKVCELFENNGVKRNDELLWSYGNSQKIVNMSVKYIVTLTIILKNLKIEHEIITKIGDKFLDIIDQLDIPVD
ncbi:MAG: hypothetical protein J5874_00585, partial [Oscillospiraceae bacterium]|nr:hypothetical protein [Oscillospiraceae bacterium]